MKLLGNNELTGSFDDDCVATREVLDRVGDKWSVLVIVVLGSGTRRFNDLKRAIEGISQRMLTLTLRGLERDGLVKRTVYPTVPPRVDYVLTPLGRTLLEPVSALAGWAQRHREEVQRARDAFERAARAAPSVGTDVIEPSPKGRSLVRRSGANRSNLPSRRSWSWKHRIPRW